MFTTHRNNAQSYTSPKINDNFIIKKESLSQGDGFLQTVYRPYQGGLNPHFSEDGRSRAGLLSQSSRQIGSPLEPAPQ